MRLLSLAAPIAWTLVARQTLEPLALAAWNMSSYTQTRQNYDIMVMLRTLGIIMTNRRSLPLCSKQIHDLVTGGGLLYGDEMKGCSKCKLIKDLSFFYPDKSRKDGFTTWCKSCFSEYSRSEAGKAKIRKYKNSEKGREKVYAKHAKKRHTARARQAVYKAVKLGKLQPPHLLTCADCSGIAKEYHHTSYLPEDRLRVVPLCQPCHILRHNPNARVSPTSRGSPLIHFHPSTARTRNT